MAESKETIVMFPFMAQGHIIPFLALALQIEQRGFNIIFVNTPRNIKELRQAIPPCSAIRLHEIPFDAADHGLPPAAENTDILPYSLVIRLLEASASLKPAFTSLLAGLVRGGAPPLGVVADIFFGWSAEVANELGLFHAVFSGSGGFGLACYYSMWLNLPHRTTTSPEFTLPDFSDAGKLHVSQLTESFITADGTDRWSVFQRKNLPAWSNSNGVLFNSIAEIDQIGLAYFRRKLNLPVWPIGPVLLAGDNRTRARKQTGMTPEYCIHWLDSKPPNSVLYISFGSMNTISASQMTQLAKALNKISYLNFIWVVRPPIGFDITAEFRAEEWLPEGFTRRVVEEERRGLIVHRWAPQVEILSHESVGGFLSHCGWNSVLESLGRGVPILGWPMAAEQFFNAKFLAEEIGVCVEVAGGVRFAIRHEDLVEKIEIVMSESERGKEMRRRAGEVKEMIREAIRDEEGFKGSSTKAMDEFLEAALLMKKTTQLG
ncbi:UDP-glycosyltransferase [Actinidia chinensis var. chinensis]|uniref:Glycosyltransferase n=1 Tax=Actinidia chinensis var. chinensis TaxID=1590841 RepID=A0A2R6PFQ2_ACTCC|nr:UDP-glycosyltransferase [Actinidia chinensis var. chinensis]